MEYAASQINSYLDGGGTPALSAVLNAHASNELREKEFLKNTIADISHQLKTPLAALNNYNGLLKEESKKGADNHYDYA